MTAALIAVFVLTYGAIALEGPLRVNKSAAALVGAGLHVREAAAVKSSLEELFAELTGAAGSESGDETAP